MRTRELVVLMALVVLVAAFAFAVPARADQGERDEGAEIVLDASCPGELVIDVRHKVVNDGDSGVTRWWAYDNYRKHIRVWQTGAATFCIVVLYDGEFTATAGPSPGNTGSINAGTSGSMTGGYRATVTGALNASPSYKTKGYLGKFDYGWTGDPNNPAPTPFGWFGIYFLPGATFDYVWWGWTYNAGEYGIWFNAQGNGGDITN